jgi:hypothetical protein
VEHVRIGELAETAGPQMLLDLDEINHQHAGEQRLLAGRVVAEQRDPSGNADGDQRRQEFLPIGSETRNNRHRISFDVVPLSTQFFARSALATLQPRQRRALFLHELH